MNTAYARMLVDYHYWALDRVLTAVAALDAEAWDRDLGSSFRSVRATLQHLYGAEVVWLRRWHGESPTAFPGAMPRDVASLTAAWRTQEAALREFVMGLDDQALAAVHAYRLMSGAEGQSAMWQMLAHVVNHGTYHRGQVTTMLRQLGAPPPASLDMIAFFREQGG